LEFIFVPKSIAYRQENSLTGDQGIRIRLSDFSTLSYGLSTNITANAPK